jgi:hypothetical protein
LRDAVKIKKSFNDMTQKKTWVNSR